MKIADLACIELPLTKPLCHSILECMRRFGFVVACGEEDDEQNIGICPITKLSLVVGLRRLSRTQNDSDSTKNWFVHQNESIALYNGCFSKNGFALFVTFMNRRCKKGMEYNTVQQKWIWHELPFHNQNQLFLQCWEHDNNYTDIEKFALLQLSLLFLICEWICSMNEYAKLSLADKFLWWQIDGE